MFIKSVTDVITNSSSEVYAIVDDGTCNHIKSVVEKTFKLFGEEINLDDYCTLEPKVGLDWDWREKKDILNNPDRVESDEEREELANNEEAWKNWLIEMDDELEYHAPWVGCGIEITWKKEDSKIKALLEDIIGTIDYYNLAQYDV